MVVLRDDSTYENTNLDFVQAMSTSMPFSSQGSELKNGTDLSPINAPVHTSLTAASYDHSTRSLEQEQLGFSRDDSDWS